MSSAQTPPAPRHLYRPDIDGLRTIAVVPVIVFHADLHLGGRSLLPGGFLGVDVFFVISGFLISGMIIAQLSAGRFQLSEFYRRRAMRLLPAVCTVILTSLPLAWLLYQPSDFSHFITSALAALLFVSNVWFAQGSDYFAETTEHMPLLHTWSLSVEEQFYLVFPLLLIGLWRWSWNRNWIAWLVVGLGALSFLSYLILQTRAPNWVFYLSVTRGWELLVGVLIALKGASLSGAIRQSPWLAAGGLGLIMAAMIFASDNGAAQMIGRIAAVVGTGLLLITGSASHAAGAVLRHPAMVGIGKVSYSLYLWHWPGLAFLVYVQLNGSEMAVGIVLAVSLACALASYRWIETPLRYHHSLGPVLVMVGATLAIVGSVWLWAVSSTGQVGRDWVTPPQTDLFGQVTPPRGNINPPGAAVHVINVGDSHSGALGPALSAMGQDQGFAVTHLQSSGVLPVRGMSFLTDGQALDAYRQAVGDHLLDLIDSTIAAALADAQTPLVMLSARWPYYLSGVLPTHPQTGLQEAGGSHLPSLDGVMQATAPQISAALDATISAWRAQGAQVVLVYPMPEQIYHPARLEFAATHVQGVTQVDLRDWPFGLPNTVPHGWYLDRTAQTYEMLDQVGALHNVAPLYPDAFLCPAGHEGTEPRQCSHKIDSVVMYRDDDHLSAHGAALVLQGGLLPLLVQAGHSPR